MVNAMGSVGRAEDVVELFNDTGSGPVVLACEHASNLIPQEYGGLGLDECARESHIAWDPGALAVALLLSAGLDAPLVASKVSRLVYDCNRPPDAPSAMPARSEIYDIPGNAGLSDADRRARAARFYNPFRDRLAAVLEQRQGDDRQLPVLVTIHTFTRIYNGHRRDVDLGILHDEDRELADLLLAGAALRNSSFKVQRNQPYGPADGVTHTLKVHGLQRGLPNVMIEICNDLVADERGQHQMAQLLSTAIKAALPQVRIRAVKVSRTIDDASITRSI